MLTEIAQDSRGNKLYIEENGVGGHCYWSDEIGSGVRIWDTSISTLEMLKLIVKHIEEFGE